MASEHWFDVLQRQLADGAPRRGLLHSAGALLAGTMLHANLPFVIAKGKHKKGKNKHHGQKPNHKRPDHLGDPKPGEDDCEAYFDDPELQHDCKNIRANCHAPKHLCIYAVDSPGEDDRGVACCPSNKECCLFGCTDTKRDRENCDRCGKQCADGEICLDGVCTCPDGKKQCVDGCVDTQTDPRNCRRCGTRCPDGWACCNGNCVDLDSSTTNCRECGHECPFGEGAPSNCCNGACVNIITDPLHCGGCNRSPCPLHWQCCGGVCFDPTNLTCCPDGFKACPSPKVCCTDQDGLPDCCG